MLSMLILAGSLLAMLLALRSYAIFVPTINAPHVVLGLIDSENPNSGVDNKPFNDLRASGCLLVDPQGLANLGNGGDKISVPSPAEPSDFVRVDRTSATPISPASVSDNTDVAVVQWNKRVHEFLVSDRARSGLNYDAVFSQQVGGKVAKRLFELLTKVAVAALDSLDTPSANYHTVSVYNSTTPAYPTLETLRQTKATLGDAGQRLTTCVLHSASYNKLLYDLITSYGAGAVHDQVATSGLLGQLLGIKNWIVSDAVPITGGGTDNHNTLLLGPGALWAGFQLSPDVRRQQDVLNPTTRDLLSIEFAAVAHLRFLKYTSGTMNPADTDLATAGNWDEAYDDHRRVLAAKLVSN